MLGVLIAVDISKLPACCLFPSMPASIPSWAVITGLSVSIGVGLIFRRLARAQSLRLDPDRVPALRIARSQDQELSIMRRAQR